MAKSSKTHGLTCPNCGGVVPVPEGARIVACPFCEMRSLVQGDRGIRRWQVTNKIDREKALEAVRGSFSGLNKARDLKREAHIGELFLAYLPYWQVKAFVAGWIFGRVKSGKDSTKPVEIEVMEDMQWVDAATDVSEFGVHQVSVSHNQLEPYDAEILHAEGMVFEPVESRSEALDEARMHFTHRARSKRSLKQKYFERFHLLGRRQTIIYYPLWVARYHYRDRSYQVVVDGVDGDVLYGKAPGNIFYRAIMLVVGMAAGTFILVNGTILAGTAVAATEEGEALALLCLPIAIGLGLIALGYRRFRYGEEVETMQKGAKKADLGKRPSGGLLPDGLRILEEFTDIEIPKM